MKKIIMMILTGSLVTGIILCVAGFLRNDPSATGYGEAGKPLIITGAILVGIPAITFWLIFAAWVIRQLRASWRAYASWKSTLSPGQQATARFAESAAILGAGWYATHELRKWEERTNAELTQTQVNGFGAPWSGLGG